MFFAFRAPLPTTDGKKLPERLLVAKWGRNDAPSKGVTFYVNDTTVRELPRNQIAVGFDQPALDFEHNTLPGTEAYNAEKEPRAIAATGAFSVVPGEGLYFTPTRWTPEGERSVLGGHHPDISPALKFNAKGEVILGHSVALCRNGSVPDLQVFSVDGLLAEKFAALSAVPPTTHSTAMNHKELLCLILGLSATATDVEIATAAKTFATNAAAAQTGVQAFSTQLNALQKRIDDQEREHITALAIRDGKVVPLSASKLPIEDFRAFVAELQPNQVPLAQRTVEGLKAFSASGVMSAAASAADEDVRMQLGISKEEWAKA
ncbi:phage protease [Horticoccus sp. 23ND18S-11]|uniref:phage protease n=1 Tax=Horticoccus sp. 23ND18S-11 TaxID=3391832 RepID=UPI0039C90D93